MKLTTALYILVPLPFEYIRLLPVVLLLFINSRMHILPHVYISEIRIHLTIYFNELVSFFLVVHNQWTLRIY